jgi:ComF family protein
MGRTELAYLLYRLPWNALDLLFPPVCGGCGRAGSRWCPACQAQLPLLRDPLCDLCGVPLDRAGRCQSCRGREPPFRILRSWCAFDSPIRNALHRLKYRHDVGLGDALAAQLVGFVRQLAWPVELIVPVPLGAARLRQRGYNQTSLIARPLALALGIGFAPASLARVRETKSQVGLTKTERHENVHAAFQAEESRVSGRTILLMDDVATTGSTLSSCAEALCRAGARDVFALTIARALPRHGLGGA